MNVPEDSIAFADQTARAHLHSTDDWLQKAIERRGTAPNQKDAIKQIQLARLQLAGLLIQLPGEL